MEPSVSTGPPAAVPEAARADLLPVDPELEARRLPNGLRVWVRPNRRPPGEVGLRLHLSCGSLGERDEERGLAHFLEHLVFRGTENFPPGAMEAFFESLGTRLGREHNAATGLLHTVFSLSLPANDAKTLRRGLLCLSDIGFRFRPGPATIEAERRVILEEIRDRRNRLARWQDRVRRFEIPAKRAHARHPLGDPSVLEAADASRLTAFYRRWYRPDLATLLIGGDVDPEPVLEAVGEHFAEWSAAGDPPPPAATGLRLDADPRARVLASPEQHEAEVRLVAIRSGRPPATRAEFDDGVHEQLATQVLNRRLATAAANEGLPVHRTRALLARVFGEAQVARASIAGAPERIEALARMLFSELRRLGRHGVLDEELARATAGWRAAARREAEETPRTAQLLSRMQEAVALERPPMSPRQRYEVTDETIERATRERVLAAYGRAFEAPGRRALALLPSSAPRPRDAELLAWLEAAQRRGRTRPARPRRTAELPSGAASARRILDSATDPELGILSAAFEHGVRLHLHRVADPSNRVVFRLTLGGGRIEETEPTHGLTAAASVVCQTPATRELGTDEVRDLLIGRSLQMSAAVDEDGIRLGFSCSPEDLEFGLRFLTALLQRPRIDAAAFERWRARAQVWRPDLDSRIALRSLELLSGGDVRFRFLEAERAARITRRAAQAWLDDLVARGPIEAAIVGNLDPADALELAGRVLAPLAPRPADAGRLDSLRTLRTARGPHSGSVRLDDGAQRGAVFIGWRAPPWQAVRDRRLFLMAQRILQGRLSSEIRERQALAYSPRCSYSPSKAYPRGSLFAAAFYAAPDRVELGAAAARDLVLELARRGPTRREIEQTRKQVCRLIEETQDKPIFWARALCDLRYHGGRIEDLKHALDHYRSFTSADVREALQRYLVDEGRIEVVSRAPRAG